MCHCVVMVRYGFVCGVTRIQYSFVIQSSDQACWPGVGWGGGGALGIFSHVKHMRHIPNVLSAITFHAKMHSCFIETNKYMIKNSEFCLD